MIKEILYKVFGIEPFPCLSCETLKQQLAESNREKSAMLEIILDKNRPTIKEETPTQEFKPIGNAHMSWNVRRQMLEAEDRQRAQLIKKQQELEKELGLEEKEEVNGI